jgi:hypothetical protein
MGGMRLRMLIAGLSAAATLAAQQTAGQSSVWTRDVNGNRVDGPSYSYIETPQGNQRAETAHTINGRLAPIQSTEDKVLQDDSQTKVVERVIRKYDPTGVPGQPITIRIEEKKNPDGSTSVQSTAYETDINGNKRLFERSTTHTRPGAATTETSTTVERATLNGGLQVMERDATVERKNGDTSKVESTTYRRDVSGNFTPFAQSVKETSKTGGLETADATNYEMGPDGKLRLASREVDHVVTKPDGSKVVDSDVYSRFNAGHLGDANAIEPRLQQQVHKELVPGPGGVTIETTSVRSRLGDNSSGFGAYEKVSQTTYTSADASGHKIENSSSVGSRRDPNGDIVVDQGMVNHTVETKK